MKSLEKIEKRLTAVEDLVDTLTAMTVEIVKILVDDSDDDIFSPENIKRSRQGKEVELWQRMATQSSWKSG